MARYRRHLVLVGNPAMDKHPVQGGLAILLGMLYVKETRISFVRLGFWLMYAFTYLPETFEQPRPQGFPFHFLW